jgi:hypothetical protein
MTTPLTLSLSREERALYNDAFMALVCARAVQGHRRQYQQRPCPVAIAVTAAVMALQPAVREVLPTTLNANFPKWVGDHPAVRVLMARSASALSAVVRPGLLFALQTGVLALEPPGRLNLPGRRIPATISGDSAQVVSVQKAAYLLGRWLPSAGSTSTVLTLLGVRP